LIKKRTKLSATVFVMLAVGLLLTTFMSAASATTSMTISGKWAMTGGTTIDQRSIGNNGFLHLHGTGFFIGGISGPFTSDAYWWEHNVGAPNEWTNGLVIITISPATVMGKTGTLLFTFSGILGGGGSWIIISGTGQLANLHGHGTFSSTGGFPQIAYEGQIHFSP
jgi:hypothetical protein